MKLHTRWKRVKNKNILGQRFFDGGEFGLGFFTIEKAYKCKEYSSCAIAPNGTRWFDVGMIVVRTDNGLVYKLPFCPWLKVYSADGNKALSKFYDEQPW